jgi:hypothetical protein
MQLTEWHPPEIKPVREGVYQVKSVHWSDPWFSRWDGKQWMWLCSGKERAARVDSPAPYQERMWRGLAAEPKQVSTL